MRAALIVAVATVRARVREFVVLVGMTFRARVVWISATRRRAPRAAACWGD